MVSDNPGAPRARRSANEVRHASFTQRRRGLDPAEVREFLEGVADQMQAAEDERALMLAEIERLRSTSQPGERAHGEVNTQAVALLSRAQLVADQLVADHEQHSRHLMTNARAQQREMLDQANGSPTPRIDTMARGYVVPVPDIEYVRTYTRIAQAQLRSVLESLAEQVDKLDELPQLGEERL
jgi:cell division initiation protein